MGNFILAFVAIPALLAIYLTIIISKKMDLRAPQSKVEQPHSTKHIEIGDKNQEPQNNSSKYK